VFVSEGSCLDAIRSYISREVAEATNAGSLLRANSNASKIMKSFSGMIGKDFLELVLGDEIRRICDHPVEDGASYEVDPAKIPSSESMEKNRERLQSTCSRVLRRILDSLDQTPTEIRAVCNDLQTLVAAKFPSSAQLCVGGFLFLRYFCPAIVTPHAFRILKSPPASDAQRGLTNVAKTLQNVANNITFGQKEQHFEWLNDFITTNFSALQDYFDAIATPPKKTRKSIMRSGVFVTDEDVLQAELQLSRHLKGVWSKLKDKYEAEAWFQEVAPLLKEVEKLEQEQKTREQEIQSDKA